MQVTDATPFTLPIISNNILQEYGLPYNFQLYELQDTNKFIRKPPIEKRTGNRIEFINSYEYIRKDDSVDRDGKIYINIDYDADIFPTDKIYRRRELNFIFESGKSVPDILLLLIQLDPLRINVYERLLRLINSPNLNQSELELLKTKYKPYTFKNLNHLPENIPLYAIRNVSLYQWAEYDLYILTLINHPNRPIAFSKNKKETTKYYNNKLETHRHRNKITKVKGRIMGRQAKFKQVRNTDINNQLLTDIYEGINNKYDDLSSKYL
jgi:hypothetical protein